MAGPQYQFMAGCTVDPTRWLYIIILPSLQKRNLPLQCHHVNKTPTSKQIVSFTCLLCIKFYPIYFLFCLLYTDPCLLVYFSSRCLAKIKRRLDAIKLCRRHSPTCHWQLPVASSKTPKSNHLSKWKRMSREWIL